MPRILLIEKQHTDKEALALWLTSLLFLQEVDRPANPSRASAGMLRLTAATAILAIGSGQTPARHAGLSRAIHASAAGAANKNKKRPTKGTNLKKPVTPPPKAVPEVKSGTGVSDKIQGQHTVLLPSYACDARAG